MQGHDSVVDLLIKAGAQLGMDPLEGFGAICRALIEGEMQMLRRLLRAGAKPSWAGFDGRTALHVAASEGNLQAVSPAARDGGRDSVPQTMRGARRPTQAHPGSQHHHPAWML